MTIEFDWNMETIRCRQIVDERLQLAMDQLPDGIIPRMAPMASMMGQVMHLTIWDEKNELSPMELWSLADWVVRKRILSAGGVSEVLVIGGDVKQFQVRSRIDDMFRHKVTFEEIQKALEGSGCQRGYVELRCWRGSQSLERIKNRSGVRWEVMLYFCKI